MESKSDVIPDTFTVETSGLGEPPLEGAPEPIPEPEPDSAPAPAGETTPEPPPTPDRNPDGTFKSTKGKKDPQARIDHVTWEREEARREATRERERREAVERELEAYRRGTGPAPSPAPSPTRPVTQAEWQRYKAMPDAPRSDSFESYDDYTAALSLFIADKRFEERVAAAQHHRERVDRDEQQHQRLTAYAERMGTVLASDPQFLERLSPEVANLRPTSHLDPSQSPTPLSDLAEEVLDSPHAGALLRHFSDHPDDLRRFAGLKTRKELLREFTKLETRFDAAPSGSAPSPPALSTAKPPIKPVGSAPPAVEDEGSDEEPLSVFITRENAKLARAGRRR